MSDFRSRFPIFKNQPNLAYLDNAATTQRVDSALETEQSYYLEMNANVHRSLFPMAEQATTAYEAVRETVRSFINAREAAEIVFTRGATESLNLVAQGWGGQFLKPGDEVVLTLLEHHSNLVPWQMVAQKTGAVLKFVPITETGELDMEAFANLVTDRTKMISVTGLSNSLGTVVDIPAVVKLARSVGAKVCVDAAQAMAHLPVDVQDWNVDFLAFSSHKLYGPTGAGVLYAKREILEEMEPVFGGGDMIREVHLAQSTWNDVPYKFEAGTPSIGQVIGMGAAVEFLGEVGMEATLVHDRELLKDAFSKLEKLDFVDVFGPKDVNKQVGIISFLVKNVHPHDVAALLGEQGVCVRAGHHCTMPLMQELQIAGTTRASFGIYNTKDDVDRFIEGLQHLESVFLTN